MNKGFTLVEVLAVIIIIGILSVIIAPNILNVFDSSKNRAYSEQVSSMIKASKTYYAEFSEEVLFSESTAQIPLSKLISKGYIKDIPVNPKTGNEFCDDSYITITKSSNKYTYSIHLEDC